MKAGECIGRLIPLMKKPSDMAHEGVRDQVFRYLTYYESAFL